MQFEQHGSEHHGEGAGGYVKGTANKTLRGFLWHTDLGDL